MKKLILLFLFLSGVAIAQLNNRFYTNGSPQRAAEVGAYGAVTYLQWKDMQNAPAFTYTWTVSDAAVQAYQAAGLKLMITLSCTHPNNNTDYATPGTCAYTFAAVPGSDNNANWPVKNADTTLWKNFITAMVDRYDKDGINDYALLNSPITEWHIIGQEWSRVWCDYPFGDGDVSKQYAIDFVNLVNMTYRTIKAKQPTSKVSYAGIDVRYQPEAFYDGYHPATQTIFCSKSNNCTTFSNLNQAQIGAAPKFLPSKQKVMYILKNAYADEVDIHQYGRWKNIPDFVRWARDSTYGKPITFMEGGGPYCGACDSTYHSALDTDGRLPAPLVRDNASYVVYHFITSLANGVRRIHWNSPPEYVSWGATFGDLDLRSLNNIKKPSYFTYRFMAQNIFSNANADTVLRIVETNTALYHYRIDPLDLHVAWSTNATDSIVINGSGQLFMWNIPTTCQSIYPSLALPCDSIIQQSSVTVSGSYTIHLNNGVPVFYSWNNVISLPENFILPNSYSLHVFPNPFSDKTTVRTDKILVNATVSIVNLFGQTIKKIDNVSGQMITISCDDIPGGLYFINVIQNGKTLATQKMVILD